MTKQSSKCKTCKGRGIVEGKECTTCEGTGVPLVTNIEEQFNEASEFDGTKVHSDETSFIEFEEDDYEV